MNQVGGPLLHTAGLPRHEQEKLLRRKNRGELIRLARGVYIEHATHRAMTPDQRHVCRIIAHSVSAPRAVVAGLSAAALQGLPTATGLRNQPVEIVGILPEGRRRESQVRRRTVSPAALADSRNIRTRYGTTRVTGPVHTALDLARWHSLSDGVVALDHGLKRKLFTPDAVDAALGHLRGFRGVDAARRASSLATAHSDSPRESELKVSLWRAGLPAPHQQARLIDEFGHFLGRVDFFWPEIAFGLEYDGEGKYRGEFGVPEAVSIRDDLDRQHAIVNLGVTLHRTDRENFRDGSALSAIVNTHRRLTARGVGLERRFWTSAGLAW